MASAAVDPTPELSDGLVLTLRSASNPRAAQIMRECLAAHVQKQLTDCLAGHDAEVRAALLIAICTGAQFRRNVLGKRVLNDTDLSGLKSYLKAALDAVVKTPLPSPALVRTDLDRGPSTVGGPA